jgi:hypothetical protein
VDVTSQGDERLSATIRTRKNVVTAREQEAYLYRHHNETTHTRSSHPPSNGRCRVSPRASPQWIVCIDTSRVADCCFVYCSNAVRWVGNRPAIPRNFHERRGTYPLTESCMYGLISSSVGNFTMVSTFDKLVEFCSNRYGCTYTQGSESCIYEQALKASDGSEG